MSTMTFADATAVARRSDGAYDVDLKTEYAIGGVKPNGGYLLACLGRAALAAARDAGSAHRHVVAAGAQFLASPDVGAARIDVDVLRVGRSATQVAARVAPGPSSPGVYAQFTLATLPSGTRPFWGAVEPVAIPPFEQCEPPGGFASKRSGITVVFDPDTNFTVTPDGPVAGGHGELRAWFRDDHGDVVDPVALLFVADSLPPATFGVISTGWVPTLDLTVYVRAVPEPGPLRLRFRVNVIQDGFADETCEAWDSAGRLVLQSTQLAALRLPG